MSRMALAALCIGLPWLNPFSPGPTPAVVSLLFAWACFATFLAASLGADPPSGGITKEVNMAKTVTAAWLAAALASAVLGLLQFFSATAVFGDWVNSSAPGEAYANLRQRNQFATLTSIGLLSLLWQLVQWWSPTSQRAWGGRRSLLCAGVVLLALGNAASGSRTGLLQWLLIFGLAVVWRPRGQWCVVAVSAGALVAYLVAALVLPRVLEWVTGLNSHGLLGRFAEEAGCSSRRVLWSNVLHLIVQKPWTGWGWGELDYAHFITLYPGERFCDILDNAHNFPLHLAVELGVPFALAVCSGGLWWVWRAKPWNEQDATRQLAWGVLAVILLHSMLEYPLWYGPFQLAAGLSVWLLWRTPESWRFKGLSPVKSACVAIVLIALIVFAAWDYWRIGQLYLPVADRASAYQENTLQKVQGSWLFRDQVRFAELATTPLTPDNAVQINTLAHQLLHFSPEPRVIEKLIESAVMLGRDDEALFCLQRFQAAFPQAHAAWAAESSRDETP